MLYKTSWMSLQKLVNIYFTEFEQCQGKNLKQCRPLQMLIFCEFEIIVGIIWNNWIWKNFTILVFSSGNIWKNLERPCVLLWEGIFGVGFTKIRKIFVRTWLFFFFNLVFSLKKNGILETSVMTILRN